MLAGVKTINDTGRLLTLLTAEKKYHFHNRGQHHSPENEFQPINIFGEGCDYTEYHKSN